FGFANEYDVERKFRETRLYQVAPISTNLILSYVAEHLLELPRSFLTTQQIEGWSRRSLGNRRAERRACGAFGGSMKREPPYEMTTEIRICRSANSTTWSSPCKTSTAASTSTPVCWACAW